jgi:nitrate reductase alpha subunit
VSVDFPHFTFEGPRVKSGSVPIKEISSGNERLIVTTVLDLLIAHTGIDRTPGTDNANDYDDPRPYTPAW